VEEKKKKKEEYWAIQTIGLRGEKDNKHKIKGTALNRRGNPRGGHERGLYKSLRVETSASGKKLMKGVRRKKSSGKGGWGIKSRTKEAGVRECPGRSQRGEDMEVGAGKTEGIGEKGRRNEQ